MKKSILLSIMGCLTVLSIIISSNQIVLSVDQPDVLPSQESTLTGKELQDNDIYLHIGSPLILSQNKISPLDPENLDVAATLVSNRTLVPLRALSEYFGADVEFDKAHKAALINYNGKKFEFPLDTKKYIKIDGSNRTEIPTDIQTLILNNRTMVPLKVICEDILGRKVNYYNDVIAVTQKEIDLKNNPQLVKDVKSKIGSALKVQSLSQLKAAIPQQYEYIGGIRRDAAGLDYNAVKSDSPLENTSQSAEAVENGYSTTNTQVMGIDEADIVKTDGSYIYIAGGKAVHIVCADKGIMKDISLIKMGENKNVSEIYIDKNRLVVIGTRFERTEGYPVLRNNLQPENDAKSLRIIPPYYSRNFSFIDIYNITDPQKPVLIKGHEMEGNYQSSRKNGNIVYLITDTYLNNNIVLPMMRDSKDSQLTQIPLKDIMIMPGCPVSGYITVSALNIYGSEKAEIEAITTSSHVTYMNSTSLYLVMDNYNGMSSITKFKINGMNIGYAGSGNVKGTILNQFSMDEYKGNFRVATTSNDDNNLFILDDSLNVCGSVIGMAKGERIYSVRFMEDKGYIVTFRSIDPLFVFDLSDPRNPKITGELKIPGFSNYLHPVSKNTILGIGQDTYEIYKKDSSGNDVVIGTRQGGIKLSLFDVSDMGKPKEISKYILGDTGSYSEVFYDHKAAMFDYSSNNVVFDATYTDGTSDKYKQGAVVFNYGGNSLELKGVLDYIQPEVSGVYTPYGRRNVYIGNELYYIQDGIISSYDYKTLKLIQTLNLK